MTRAARCENQLSAVVQVLAECGGEILLEDALEGLGPKDAQALKDLFDYFSDLAHEADRERERRAAAKAPKRVAKGSKGSGGRTGSRKPKKR